MSVALTDDKRLSLGSLLGILATVAGVLADPTVLALLPTKVSAPLTIAGVLIAAISKKLVHTTE